MRSGRRQRTLKISSVAFALVASGLLGCGAKTVPDVALPPPCPEPTEEMMSEVEKLPEPWFLWLVEDYDPFCDALARGRRVAGPSN